MVLEPGRSSLVDELVRSRFAFADPRGLVTRWGAGAEALFDLAPEQIVGQPLFEVALGGSDAGWRPFLDGDQAQSPASLLEVSVTRPDGQGFPCQVHLVPVLLSDGLDFSQFAADLTSGQTGSVDAFRQRHARVLSLIDAAAREGAGYAEGERLAGLIAIFRSAAEGPVTPGERIDEALSRAERAEQELEDLRDPLARVGAEFAPLRAGMDELRERMASLEAAPAPAHDAETIAAEVEATVGERIEAATTAALAGRIDDAVEARIEAALPARVEQAVAERVERMLASRLEELLAPRIDEALAARVEPAVARQLEQVLPGRVERALEGRVDELVARGAREAPPAVRQPGDDAALAARIEEGIARRIEHTLAERVEDAVRRRIEQALPERVEAAVAGRVEERQPEDLEGLVSGLLERALPARIEELVADRLDEAVAAAREAREEAEQVGRELRAGGTPATKPLPVGFYSRDAHPAAPERPPLPDFDEVAAPLAALSLEGRFTHLNSAFRELVGYSEEEFSSARWPSAADPEQVASQRELREAMAAGEIDEAPIETAYMHREGLLVPLIGRMSLVRDGEGTPDHLLFRVGVA